VLRSKNFYLLDLEDLSNAVRTLNPSQGTAPLPTPHRCSLSLKGDLFSIEHSKGMSIYTFPEMVEIFSPSKEELERFNTEGLPENVNPDILQFFFAPAKTEKISRLYLSKKKGLRNRTDDQLVVSLPAQAEKASEFIEDDLGWFVALLLNGGVALVNLSTGRTLFLPYPGIKLFNFEKLSCCTFSADSAYFIMAFPERPLLFVFNTLTGEKITEVDLHVPPRQTVAWTAKGSRANLIYVHCEGGAIFCFELPAIPLRDEWDIELEDEAERRVRVRRTLNLFPAPETPGSSRLQETLKEEPISFRLPPHSIDLHSNMLSGQDFELLLGSMQHLSLSELSFLDLSSNPLGPASLRLLPPLPLLTHLNLAATGMKAEELNTLCQELASGGRWPSLQYLGLRANPFDLKGALILAEALSSCSLPSHLLQIDVSCCSLSPEGVLSLFRAWFSSSTAPTLDLVLEGNGLSRELLDCLCKLCLNLISEITIVTAGLLYRLFEAGEGDYSALGLGHHPWGDWVLNHDGLAETLASLPSLPSSLHTMLLLNSGQIPLDSLFACGQHLTKMVLREAKTFLGTPHLDHLKNCLSLEHFELSRATVKQSLRPLLRTLSCLPKLQSLLLKEIVWQEAEVTEEEWVSLLKGTSLSLLDLFSCNLTDQQVALVVEAARKAPNLKGLCLEGNQCKEASLSSLSALLQENPHLTKLAISSSKLGNPALGGSFFSSLALCREMQDLNLTFDELPLADLDLVSLFCSAVGSLAQLKSLAIEGTVEFSEDSGILTSALKGLPCLQSIEWPSLSEKKVFSLIGSDPSFLPSLETLTITEAFPVGRIREGKAEDCTPASSEETALLLSSLPSSSFRKVDFPSGFSDALASLLPSSPSLTSASLANKNMSEEEAGKLISSLQQAPHLESLKLSLRTGNLALSQHLFQSLMSLCHLKKLSIYDVFSSLDFSFLPAAFGGENYQLSQFSLSGELGGKENLSFLLSSLAKAPKLSSLCLVKTKLPAGGGKILGDFLRNHSTLEELSLSEIGLGDELEGLLQGLCQNPVLRHLALTESKLGGQLASFVFSSLFSSGSSLRLESVDFSRNELGLSGTWGLVEMMKKALSLRSLSLADCSLDSSCLPAFQAFLDASTQLTSLNIQNISSYMQGASLSFPSSLLNLTCPADLIRGSVLENLQELSITGNIFRIPHASSFPSLRTLEFSEAKFLKMREGYSGEFEVLPSFISASKSLQHLILGRSPPSPASLTALADAVMCSPFLLSIDLEGMENPPTDIIIALSNALLGKEETQRHLSGGVPSLLSAMKENRSLPSHRQASSRPSPAFPHTAEASLIFPSHASNSITKETKGEKEEIPQGKRKEKKKREEGGAGRSLDSLVASLPDKGLGFLIIPSLLAPEQVELIRMRISLGSPLEGIHLVGEGWSDASSISMARSFFESVQGEAVLFSDGLFSSAAAPIFASDPYCRSYEPGRSLENKFSAAAALILSQDHPEWDALEIGMINAEMEMAQLLRETLSKSQGMRSLSLRGTFPSPNEELSSLLSHTICSCSQLVRLYLFLESPSPLLASVLSRLPLEVKGMEKLTVKTPSMEEAEIEMICSKWKEAPLQHLRSFSLEADLSSTRPDPLISLLTSCGPSLETFEIEEISIKAVEALLAAALPLSSLSSLILNSHTADVVMLREGPRQVELQEGPSEEPIDRLTWQNLSRLEEVQITFPEEEEDLYLETKNRFGKLLREAPLLHSLSVCLSPAHDSLPEELLNAVKEREGTLTSLSSVSLSARRLFYDRFNPPDPHVFFVHPLFSLCHGLKTLSFSFMSLPPEAEEPLLSLKLLSSLTLAETYMPPEILPKLFSQLECLTQLNVQYDQSEKEFITVLFGSLESSKSLREVEAIVGQGSSEETTLFERVLRVENLRIFKMNFLDEKCFRLLPPFLRAKGLKLRIGAVAEGNFEELGNLEVLEGQFLLLGKRELASGFDKQLAELVESFTGRTGLGEWSFRNEFFSNLPLASSLTYLDLSTVSLRTPTDGYYAKGILASFQPILECFRVCQHLSKLFLRNCSIVDFQMRHFLLVLESAPSLTVLDVTDNKTTEILEDVYLDFVKKAKGPLKELLLPEKTLKQKQEAINQAAQERDCAVTFQDPEPFFIFQ